MNECLYMTLRDDWRVLVCRDRFAEGLRHEALMIDPPYENPALRPVFTI